MTSNMSTGRRLGLACGAAAAHSGAALRGGIARRVGEERAAHGGGPAGARAARRRAAASMALRSASARCEQSREGGRVLLAQSASLAGRALLALFAVPGGSAAAPRAAAAAARDAAAARLRGGARTRSALAGRCRRSVAAPRARLLAHLRRLRRLLPLARQRGRRQATSRRCAVAFGHRARRPGRPLPRGLRARQLRPGGERHAARHCVAAGGPPINPPRVPLFRAPRASSTERRRTASSPRCWP